MTITLTREQRRSLLQPRASGADWEWRREQVLRAIDLAAPRPGSKASRFQIRSSMETTPGGWLDTILLELVEDEVLEFRVERGGRGGATATFNRKIHPHTQGEDE